MPTESTHSTVHPRPARDGNSGHQVSEVIGALAIDRDITELKKAERQLVLLNHALNNSRDAVYLIDNQLRFIHVNDVACRVLGYSREELLTMGIIDIDPDIPADALMQIMQQTVVLGPNSIETRHRTKEGHIFPVEVTGTYFEFEGECYNLALARDITERKRAERELEEKRGHLSDLALELSLTEERERQRIATKLHDTIGQDLALTRIKLGLLAKIVRTGPEQELLADAQTIVNGIIKNVRSFTNLISPPILQSSGLVAALKWLGRQMESDYGLQVRLEVRQPAKSVSRALDTELYFAVRELLINCAKHAMVMSAQLSFDREQDVMVIRVVDSGAGFDPDRIEEKLADGEGGFGLFNIRRKIVYLGGTLDIDSSPGNGTRATIRIPVP